MIDFDVVLDDVIARARIEIYRRIDERCDRAKHFNARSAGQKARWAKHRERRDERVA